MDLQNLRVVFTGGGTAGHVYPALAMIDFLKEKSINKIFYLGSIEGLESEIVPSKGIDFFPVNSGPFLRRAVFRNLFSLLKNLHGIIASLRLLGKIRPHLIVGTGGYVSFPVLAAAVIRRIPILLHEQNLYPGLVTRIMARFASQVAVSFPGTEKYFKNWLFTRRLVSLTGNPVRFTGKCEPEPRNDGVRSLLVIGGSRGAAGINTLVLDSLAELARIGNIELVWVTGKEKFTEIQAKIKASAIARKVKIKLFPYLDDMERWMSRADLIVSRAGATTISEIMFLGKPSILIPYPYATDDHQMENALFLERNGACVLLKEEKNEPISKKNFSDTVEKLLGDEKKLKIMGQKAAETGQKNAKLKIFQIMLHIIDKNLDK